MILSPDDIRCIIKLKGKTINSALGVDNKTFQWKAHEYKKGNKTHMAIMQNKLGVNGNNYKQVKWCLEYLRALRS